MREVLERWAEDLIGGEYDLASIRECAFAGATMNVQSALPARVERVRSIDGDPEKFALRP